MAPPTTNPPGEVERGRGADRPAVVGCVSFLNARPLIDGLDDHARLTVRYDVPSGLLDDLTGGVVDLALCPVIDFQLAKPPLTIVPAGAIGCDGPTLTVRLFSRVPLERVRRVHGDVDSHTSVVLLQLLMHELYGGAIAVDPLHAAERGRLDAADGPEAVLLIGDKVVAASPPAERYPYQLDLGSAWKTLTKLPFVFAVWMARQDQPLGDAPAILQAQRRANVDRLEQIAADAAERHGWSEGLAVHYLRDLLRYEVGPRHLEAMQLFWNRAAELKLVDRCRPLSLYAPMQSAGLE